MKSKLSLVQRIISYFEGKLIDAPVITSDKSLERYLDRLRQKDEILGRQTKSSNNKTTM